LIQIGLKTAEKNSAQTNKHTDRHYENNGHFRVRLIPVSVSDISRYSPVSVSIAIGRYLF